MEYLKNKNRFTQHAIIALIVSTLIIPIVIMDFWVEIYHRLCFPLYKLPYIKRKNYIQIDRHKLKYLDWFQKIYCVYCGYANGVVNYWMEIGAKTESYWCGIQHNKNPNFIEPSYHKDFAKYGDEEDFNKKYK
jgi:hypothetical protein